MASSFDLWSQAFQWDKLQRFAEDVSLLSPRANVAEETASYLRYYYNLGAKGWKAVEEFARERPINLEGFENDQDTESEKRDNFDASFVGKEWRILFGFAAQYTIYAADLVEEYLIKKHHLGKAEWRAVQGFLAGQEYEDDKQQRSLRRRLS